MKTIVILLFQCLLMRLAAQPISTDVLIIGGGASGTTAGIQAARMGVKTLIIEPTVWLGGMLTTAGVSATDGNENLPSGLWAEFRDSLWQHYGSAKAVQTGWVSNTLFEPHVGASIFKNMSLNEPLLTILLETNCLNFKKNKNGWQVKIRFKNGKTTTIKTRILIDATELGDVAAAVKIPFRIGTDDPSVYSEKNYALRQTDIVQDLTYTAILKNYGQNAAPKMAKPVGYDPKEFACACQNPLCQTDDPDRPSGVVTCEKMLTYARLPNGKILLNWPGKFGNDFYANIISADAATRQKAFDAAKQVTLRYIYFIQNELKINNLGIADDEFPTADGLPFFPYFRESRRTEGVVSMSVNNILTPFDTDLYRTGIAVGDYPIDHHHGKNANALKLNFPKVPSFNVPLGALIPKAVDNFIVAEKSISVSNIVNGTTRLQPCVMLIGQAAGAAAAICIKKNLSPKQLSVREVQSALLESGAYLMPYFDIKPSNPHFKAIQRIGATGILRGRGEPFGWANRTWFDGDSTVSRNVFLKYFVEFDKQTVFENTNLDRPFLIEEAAALLHVLSQKDVEREWFLQKMGERWADLKLNNFDPKRPITRTELAVLLDTFWNPFKTEVDFTGKLKD